MENIVVSQSAVTSENLLTRLASIDSLKNVV
jgi:hypothetical protein